MAIANPLKRDPVAAARKEREAAQRALANAQTRRQDAVAEVASAERAQEVAATADGDAAAGVLETATRRLRDARDLLEAFDKRVVPAAQAKVQEADAALVQAEKLARYTAAEAQVKAARDRLTKEYPDLQRRYSELLATVSAADKLVSTINGDLPDGAVALQTVEAPVRDIPAQHKADLSERLVSLWHHEGGERVQDQSRVKDRGDHGVYDPRDRGGVHTLSPMRCFRADKLEVTVQPYVAGATGGRMAATPLPPLRPEQPASRDPIIEYRTDPSILTVAEAEQRKAQVA